MHYELNENEIASLYSWIDSASFSRPKKNLTRDFSDGVACAELVHNFLPKLVDLHNYSPANSISQKIYNWHTLNSKRFQNASLIHTSPPNTDIINCIVHMRPGYIEYLIWDLRQKVEAYMSLNPGSGSAKTPVPDRNLASGISLDSKLDPNTPQKQQQRLQKSVAPSKKDETRYLTYADEVRKSPVHPNELASTARINTPPSLPKDNDDAQETIKLLQLKVQKMSELLDLKTEKLERMESTASPKTVPKPGLRRK